MHVEFLVEEPSCAEALRLLLPKMGLTDPHSFHTHTFQGKTDLMSRLPERLVGYSKWIPMDWRIIVLVDRDDDDCVLLKQRLEDIARQAGLSTRSGRGLSGKFQVINRIAIEELEAWFFGDIEAIRAAYPGVPETLNKKAAFRVPDGIAGGTWERLEQVLKKAGYYAAGLPKIEAARTIAAHMDPVRNRSTSFRSFRDAVQELVNA